MDPTYRTYFGADVVLRHMTALHFGSVSRETMINFMGGRAYLKGASETCSIVSISNEHEDSDRKRRRDEEAVSAHDAWTRRWSTQLEKEEEEERQRMKT